MSRERRRHVRVKPTPDAPARVTIALGGPLREAVDVVDISVGGMALATSGREVGDRVRLQLSIGRWGDHELDVVVRWVSPAVTGVELESPTTEASHAIGRYVSELLARGA